MTLSFSQTWSDRMGELAGKLNYFPYKILICLYWENIIDQDQYGDYPWLNSIGVKKPEDNKVRVRLQPKYHTIREDKADRWEAGNDIHFVINNRTKDRFQFAPVVKCVSVQKIEIKYTPTAFGTVIKVIIGGSNLSEFQISKLAINDGFPSVEAFFNFFNKDFKGKLIHWTDIKY